MRMHLANRIPHSAAARRDPVRPGPPGPDLRPRAAPALFRLSAFFHARPWHRLRWRRAHWLAPPDAAHPVAAFSIPDLLLPRLSAGCSSLPCTSRRRLLIKSRPRP